MSGTLDLHDSAATAVALRRKAVEKELDEEVQFHIERQVEMQIAKGVPPEEVAAPPSG